MSARLGSTNAAVVARNSTSGAPGEGARIHLHLVRSVRMHPGLFALVVVAGFAVAGGYFIAEWPSYDAESLVYVQPASTAMKASGVEGPPSGNVPQQSIMQQQLERVRRPEVLRGALAKLPAGSWQRNGESEQEAEKRLDGAITIDQVGGSQAGIIASASDPAVAAALANAVAASLVESAGSEGRTGDSLRSELLGEELERVMTAVEAERAELGEIQRGLAASGDRADGKNALEARIEELRRQLAKARAAHDDAVTRLVSIAAADAASLAETESELDEIAAADPASAGARASLKQRRAQLIAQMANHPPGDPENEQNAQELAQINASLEKLTNGLRAKAAAQIEEPLHDELEHTWAEEIRLNAQLAQMSGEAGRFAVRQRAADLASDIERLRNLDQRCEEPYRRLRDEDRGPAAMHVSSPALPPMHPSAMRVLRPSLALLLVGIMVALGSAVMAHRLDSRVYTVADVEGVLGCSPLAQIPDFGEVSGAVSEEYVRKLALAIECAHRRDGMKTCIVTGVGRGAGTSTVAAGVIAMLESMGQATVLVEAPARPHSAADLEQTAQNEGLAASGAEGRPSHPAEHAAGEDEAIIFTDAAPLLASKETEALAEFGDSVIVVIQSGLTTCAQLREVAQTLARLEVAAAGFVLNRVSMKANPSFRRSVGAVEERLAVQNRLQGRRSLWSRASGQDQGEPQELSEVTESDDVKQQETPKSPHASDQPAAPETPGGTPVSTSALMPAEKPAPPRASRGRGEPRRTALSSRIPRHPFPPAASARAGTVPTAVKPVAAEPAAPARSGVPARSAEPSWLPESPVRPDPPAPVRQANSAADRWMAGAPASSRPVIARQAAEEPPSDMDEPEYPVPSRLSGLRNLFVSRTRRSIEQEEEANGESEALEPRFERATMRPAYSDSPLPGAEALEGDSSRPLTAQPEFLPPRPMTEAEKEKEKDVVRPTPPRRENVDPEEIQTLPSWRGQYRKKRYPPM